MSDAFISYYYPIYFLLVIPVFLKEQSVLILSILTCYSPFDLSFTSPTPVPLLDYQTSSFFFFFGYWHPPPNYQVLSVK